MVSLYCTELHYSNANSSEFLLAIQIIPNYNSFRLFCIKSMIDFGLACSMLCCWVSECYIVDVKMRNAT